VVIKSVEFAESVEFAKMAVVEAASMKFMKPWLKCAGMKFVQPRMKPAGMKFVQPRMKPAAMEAGDPGVKPAAMEAGDAGVKSDAGETAVEPAVKPDTLEPAANCEVRPQESRTEN